MLLLHGDVMVVIGFSFKKFDVERTGVPTGKINISNNVSIKNVEEKQLALGSKEPQDGLIFTFEYNASFEPNLGKITLVGEIVYIEDPKMVKDIAKSWKKDKKIEPSIMKGILNNVLSKCTVQALILSQELNLPSPIPLPQVTSEQQQQQKK